MSSDTSPAVTGISPAEGPPGTIVKIRGENLGNNEKDLRGVVICNVDCTYTAEWKSSRLIHARTGNGFGMGEIIVFTQSGGMGSSLVKFRGYMPRVGLLTEAAVWVDESKLFEEKQQTATLSNRRAFSPNATYTDPLGVAPEETGAVLPADKIEEWYPNTTSNPLAEEFNAPRFLLERHLDTGFDALKSGYYHLQSKDTRKSVGPTSFVRGHLTTILEALHTLNEVHEMHIVNESDSIGGNICEELQGVLKSCDFVSNSLFKHILSRKDDADAKRNVLNVLHRYRFLFNLPRSIEKSIQQREYEILISDYNRAKALFQNTEVTSFKKALSEVDQKISAFSTQLKQKLFDFPTPLEEQKKIIRYLNDLDYPGNAGWECITKQALWIKSMLLDCQVEHQMIANNTNKLNITTMIQLTSTNMLLDEHRPHPFFTDVNKLTSFTTDAKDRNGSKGVKKNSKHSSNDSNSLFPRSHKRTPSFNESRQRKQSDCTLKTPAGILMVEALCSLITENVSDLWNLGQTYLSQQLGEKKDAPATKKDERAEFQATVKDVIVVFCEMVQTVIQPEEQSKLNSEREKKMKSLVPWLPGAVKCVRSTLDRLLKLGLAKDIIEPLQSLATNAIGDCIKKVLSTAVHDIKELSNMEKWQLDYSQSEYCTSLLPRIFEKIFMDSVSFAHDYIADSKLDEKDEGRVAVHKVVIQLLGDMLEGFLLSLERTVYKDIVSSNESLDKAEVEKEAIPKDMQVLVLLSNCQHVKTHVIPRVIDFCNKKGFDDLGQNLKEDIDIALEKLDERVFTTYVDMRGEPLVGEIELGINQGESGWDINKPIQGIRRYVQDILMSFTFIHHQVSSISTLFINRIFTVLFEMITDEFFRIFECIPKFSSTGALQARVELAALQRALDVYATEKSRGNIEKIFTRIPELNSNENEEMESIMTKFKNTIRYQLATFQQPGNEIPDDPKEGLRHRTQSMMDILGPEQRERVRSKGKTPKKKRSQEVKVAIEKSDPSTVSGVPTAAVVVSLDEGKKKRKAPPPPQSLTATNNATVAEKNPFLDDDEKIPKNPFMDDEEESGNPFLDDGDDDETGTNPFLD